MQVKAAMSWSLVNTYGAFLVQLLFLAALARILSPDDFGVVALAMAPAVLGKTIVDGGLFQALIKEKNPDEATYESVFWYQVLVSSLLLVAAWLLSDVAGRQLGDARVSGPLVALTFLVLLESIICVPRAKLYKALDFRHIAAFTISGKILAGIVAIGLALATKSYWSLVARELFFQSFFAGLLLHRSGWRPTGSFSLTRLSGLFQFGSKLLGTALLDRGANELIKVYVSKSFSLTETGFYVKAVQLRDISSESIRTSVNKVTYPYFSKIQDDQVLLGRQIQRTLGLVGFAVSSAVGLAVTLSHEIVYVMLGSQWETVVDYFAILSLAGVLASFKGVLDNGIKIFNRTDIVLAVKIVELLVLFTTIYLLRGLGVLGVLYAVVGQFTCSLLLFTFFGHKVGMVRFQNTLTIALRSALPALAAVALVRVVSRDQAFGLHLLTVLRNLFLFGLVWATLSALVARPYTHFFLQWFRRALWKAKG